MKLINEQAAILVGDGPHALRELLQDHIIPGERRGPAFRSIERLRCHPGDTDPRALSLVGHALQSIRICLEQILAEPAAISSVIHSKVDRHGRWLMSEHIAFKSCVPAR